MTKGENSVKEVQACVAVVGDELASGWSQDAVTVAILTVLTHWMAVRYLNGSPLADELANLSDYLEGSVARRVREMTGALPGEH